MTDDVLIQYLEAMSRKWSVGPVPSPIPTENEIAAKAAQRLRELLGRGQ